jgi:hypothetical protein
VAVLAIKNEPKCKLCQSPRRAEVDVLLERRSNLETDGIGKRINLAYVLAAFAEWGVTNPTEENVKTHWRKHCEKIESGVVEQMQTAALQALDRMERDGVVVNVNEDLDWLWAIGIAEIRERVARGDRSGITPDLLLKVAAEKTRRQHNESQEELLRSLAGGMAQALGERRVALGRPEALPEVVEDAEFAEVPA